MKKRSLRVVTLAMALAMVLTACGGQSTTEQGTDQGTAETGETVHVQWGSTGMDGMAANDAWKWAAEEITKRTDGRIEIEFLNNSALGSDESLLTQMMDGVLDVASIGTSAIGKYTPLFDGMQLPFLITSYEDELTMIQSEEMAAIKEAFQEEYGLKVMGISENGLRHFASTKHAVNTPADLKGMKMRVVPGTVIADAVAVLGANPTTISYNEIYTSLQNKIIDSEEVNYSTISVQKHYEVIKYVSEINMYPFPSIAMWRQDFFDSLSEEDQKIVMEVFAEAETLCLTEYIQEREEASREDCIEHGVQINVIEDISEFKSATEYLYDEYTAKDALVKDFVAAAQALQ